MKLNHIWKQIIAIFICSVVGYAVVFGLIEYLRRKNGPWQAAFTRIDGLPSVVVHHSRLQITNVSILFFDAPAPTNLPQTIAFEHGRPAPFNLPFGKCVFIDALYLPGTAACEIFGHEIQFMPRVLTIDRVERPWRSGEKILLTNQPSATLPPR